MKLTNSQCVLPWKGLFIQFNGDVFPCCRMIRFAPWGNINHQSIEDIINSKEAFNVREKHLENLRPLSCQDCYVIEDAGEKSVRQEFNHLFHADFQNLKKNNAQLEEIQSLDVSFSNQCQLRCRMCGHISGMREKIELSTFAFEQISKIMKSSLLKKISVSGGEPFASPQFGDFIKALVLKNDYEFEVNTNLFELSFLEDLKKINNLTFNISADAFGDRFNYIRKNHSYDLFEKNFDALKMILPEAKYKIVITLSLYNVAIIPEIIQHYVPLVGHKNILLNLLHTPSHFSINNLPHTMRDAVSKNYIAYIKQLLLKYDFEDALYLINPLRMVLNLLKNPNQDVEQFQHFLSLDTTEHFKKIFPEFYLDTNQT